MDIFAVFDSDNDGIVNFEEFNQVYSDGIELIGWFEFLNNEDVNLNKVKEEWDNSLKRKNTKKRATIM
jgi:1-phosphatidylinositol-4-phosphate 5-kinase